jgi:hypothetical protein
MRQPKLLVKMSAGPQQLTLAAGKSKVNVAVEPLFQSIKDEPKMGIAAATQWQMVTATDESDEVNSWELCHLQNGSIAKAFDYVHSLANNPNTQVHVITMSMGELPRRHGPTP